MDSSKTRVLLILSFSAVLAVFMIANRWKTATDTLKTAKPKERPQLTERPRVDRVQFLGEIFKDIKPPEKIALLLQRDPRDMPEDSLQVILRWAEETGIEPLAVMVQSDLAWKNPTETNIVEAAKALVFSGAQYSDVPVVSSWLFQQGKKFLDKGMEINNLNIPLRNAYIIYLSEYETAPMKFRELLQETLALDTNNIETNFTYMMLLKKSGQWKKAINKCQKLISLQPQNPNWLFQASDIYGNMGDTTNARTYRDLAIRVQRTK